MCSAHVYVCVFVCVYLCMSKLAEDFFEKKPNYVLSLLKSLGLRKQAWDLVHVKSSAHVS